MLSSVDPYRIKLPLNPLLNKLSNFIGIFDTLNSNLNLWNLDCLVLVLDLVICRLMNYSLSRADEL